MILALINNKGGVGKTTTAVNLAGGLARLGKQVLLIDLDSQGSASLSFGVEKQDLEPSSASVLIDGTPVRDVIRETSLPRLHLMTASERLKDTDVKLAAKYGREHFLARALKKVQDSYDFVLIDCPPSFSLVTVNALVAADHFIVPVVPHYLSLEGMANLLGTVQEIRSGIGHVAKLLGFVMTMADYRAKSTTEYTRQLRAIPDFGQKVFETEVRVNIRLAEAPSFGQTIFEYAPDSTGAEAYEALTHEVLDRLRQQSLRRALMTSNNEHS